MMAANLIVFSGLDGAGKSTQIDLLIDALRQSGKKPRYLWTRGGYTTGFEAAKRLLRRSAPKQLPRAGHSAQRDRALGNRLVRRLWLTLAMLDLLRVYGVQVRWWRWRGSVVVCDRYLWDTELDFQLNFPEEQVDRWWLWRLLKRVTPRPDAAFLLLVPVAESLRRSRLKEEPFPDSAATLSQRLAFYIGLAERESLHAIDGRREIAAIHNDIWQGVTGAAAGSPPAVALHELV